MSPVNQPCDPTPTQAATAPGRDRLAYPALLGLAALDAAGYSVIAPVTPPSPAAPAPARC